MLAVSVKSAARSGDWITVPLNDGAPKGRRPLTTLHSATPPSTRTPASTSHKMGLGRRDACGGAESGEELIVLALAGITEEEVRRFIAEAGNAVAVGGLFH